MWCFLQCKGTWRAFYHTSIHHLPRGTPFHRFALDLKVWDPFLVDVCLCGRGGTTKKDGGETVFWCVITLHPSDHLKVTLVHWEELVGSRDPDA